jgi:phosphoribosylaminoimidazolecarboxamide formyltransferase / IMP cyclohydrolase
MEDLIRIKNALISVYDKTGLEELCRSLHRHGVKLYATQGTCEFLSKNFGISAEKVEALTQFPEMMEGRVKTLHPKIFGGILARRNNAKDLSEAEKAGIPLFDLIVGNLYPFAEHLGEAPFAQSAFIDIGGPSLLRAAAKNSEAVTVVSDPSDYPELLQSLASQDGQTPKTLRYEFAARTFLRTSRYDALIAGEWAKKSEATAFPSQLHLLPQNKLRYGENPHQAAVWAGEAPWKILQGKELSFNNLLDADAAVALVSEFSQTSVVIVKHNNPCGVASGNASLSQIFSKALKADEKSAFGGIVALNRPVDEATAQAMSQIFLEVIVAPEFESSALKVLGAKKNLRLIEWKSPKRLPLDLRQALGGWLLQESGTAGIPKETRVVTKINPSAEVKADLDFAWLVCKHVRSNAIVLARDLAILSVGAGQMSRVDSVQIALGKCSADALKGAVLASDAFFPFRDNIDLLRGKGIAAVIQPGGSQRDAEVIAACDEHGIAMVFTGERHFRH